MSDPQKPWFGAKNIGVGLRPQTWQGWVVVLVPLVVVMAVLIGVAR